MKDDIHQKKVEAFDNRFADLLDKSSDNKYEYVLFLIDFYCLIRNIRQKFPGYFEHFALQDCSNNHTSYNVNIEFPFYEAQAGKADDKKIITVEKKDFFNALESTFDCKIRSLDSGKEKELSAIDQYFAALLKQIEDNGQAGSSMDKSSRSSRTVSVSDPLSVPISCQQLETLNREIIESYDRWINSRQEQAETCIEKLETKTIKGLDGFDITYFTAGDKEKPALILVNAYGMNHLLWKYVIAYFSRHYRVLIWKTRGCSEQDMDLSLEAHAQAADLANILDREQIKQAHFICWCSGLKILMEYYRMKPAGFQTISIINGYFEPLTGDIGPQTPFDKYIGSLGKFVINNATAFLRQPNIAGIIAKIFSFDFQGKVLNPTNREESVREIALKILEMPSAEIKSFLVEPFLSQKKFFNYACLIRDLQAHDISGILPDIRVPVLVISSERDIITYPESAGKAVCRLKSSEHIFLKGADHWVLWNKFQAVNPIILKHIKKYEKKS